MTVRASTCTPHPNTLTARLHFALAVVLADLAFLCRDLLGWRDEAWLRLVAGTSVMSTEPARALAELTAHVALGERPELVLSLLRHQLTAGCDPAVHDGELAAR